MSDWQYLVQQLISWILTKPHSMPVWISDRKNELTCPPPASNSIFRFVPAEKSKCLHSSCQSYEFSIFPLFHSLSVNFLESLLKTKNALYKSKPQRAQCKFGLTAEIKEKKFLKTLQQWSFLSAIMLLAITLLFWIPTLFSSPISERKKTGKDKLAVTAWKLQNCGSIKGTLSREPA